MKSLQQNTSKKTLKIQSNVPLAPRTTFGIGGPALFFTEASEISHFEEALKFANDRNIDYYILGKGSNSLFDDRGFNGLVILNKLSFIEKIGSHQVRVGSGFSFSRLGTITVKEGLTGLEFASGIPGTVGGAVYMNAGANGKETCDTLHSVEYIDSSYLIQTKLRTELSFEYRHSPFQLDRCTILAATFTLESHARAREQQIEIINKRKESQPLADKSAGCVFRNPENSSSGKLIEECGLKGLSIGGASISLKHANFIVNDGTATQVDVLKLIDTVQAKVKEKTGHALHMEVHVVPYIPS